MLKEKIAHNIEDLIDEKSNILIISDINALNLIKKDAKRINIIGIDKKDPINKKYLSYPSLKEYMNNFTSLDPKITHIFIEYRKWNLLKENIPPKRMLKENAVLFIRFPIESWKEVLEKERYLIENALNEYHFKFYNIIFTQQYLYGIFMRCKNV